jgi:dTDP-3-amino-3,4,6-trideoxy-alpha-D-glucose transaminase
LAGTFGDAAAFSFYPTKNLGALGDGGAILTADPAVAEQARLLRSYGWRTRYLSELHSTVSRLDDLQAALLLAKLGHLDGWNARRRRLAALYASELASVTGLELPPTDVPGHVHHLYVARVLGGGDRRDDLRRRLAEAGVGTDVHYPLPAHLQTPYRGYGGGPGSLPHTERLAGEVLSLPMFPTLAEEDVAYVAAQVRAWSASSTR